MYRRRASLVAPKSLSTLSKVCRQSHYLESLKILTFLRNISTATQISELDNYSGLKGENYIGFHQNPNGVSNCNSNNTDSLNNKQFSRRIEQNPSGVYRQEPSTVFQEPTSGGRSYFSKDIESFQRSPRVKNEDFSSGVYGKNPRSEFQEPSSSATSYFSKDTEGFQRSPRVQNENFPSGVYREKPRTEFHEPTSGAGKYFSKDIEGFQRSPRVQNDNFSSRNESQQTVWRNDSGSGGENSLNLMRSSRFEGGIEARPSQNSVHGQYQRNSNGYYGGNNEMSQQNFSGNDMRNVGMPQQNHQNYNPGNVQSVQAGNSGTFPQNASGYNMERHTSSSGYSREMTGQYQQNLSSFNPTSTGKHQNGIGGHQEMRSSTPVEQLINSADSSNIKGSIDELDDFCKEGKLKEAVEVLHLLEQQHIIVDLPRYIMLVDLCSENKSLEEAKSVHEHLVRSHPHLDVKMYNKILEVYGECGSMNDAFSVFETMPQRNLTSWDTMITWLSKNGHGEDAIELFAEFKKTGMKPDGQMFLGVFHACSVVGDIVEGMLHFESMNKCYGIVPSIEHYVGVVDMLGSTGYLDEAMDFIERMPVEPSIEVWETMMNLCRIHGDLELGDRCAEIAELLDPSRLDEQSKAGFLAVKASDVAKEKEKKKFAQSLLEARSRVHEYRAGDRSHPDHEKIYELLRGLKQLMKEDGYIPETKFVLHDVDQETKEEAIMAHSERLALAQGLMNSPARSQIRIIKNLRVCVDCHNALKIVSKLVGREIIMRDAKRFHHLKDGLCSCKDYW